MGCRVLLQGIFPTQALNPGQSSYISCVGRWFFTTSTTWEAPLLLLLLLSRFSRVRLCATP